MKKVNKKNNFMEKLSLNFGKLTIISIILNVLFLIFGIIIYMNPYITATVTGVLIGVYFILFGIFNIFEFLMNNIPIFKFRIFMGILTIILGIFVMLNPFNLIKVLTFTLGIYLILVAFFKVIEALKLRKFGYDGWLILLVTSIIILIFGVFITINPMAAMDLIQATGIFIILSCILEICNLLMIYGKAKEITKLFK